MWRLWCWCLMRANHQPQIVRGQSLVSGQFITGRIAGAAELRVSPSKFYRGIQQLQHIGCLGIEANSNWTTLTINNWSTYQSATTEEWTADDTTSGQPVIQRADTDKECKNERMKEVSLSTKKRTATAFVPPSVEEVRQYCDERKNGIDPEAFVAYYESAGWVMKNGRKVKNWKACVVTWEKSRRDVPVAPKPRSKVPTAEDMARWNPVDGGIE